LAAFRLVIANIIVFLIMKMVWIFTPQFTESSVSVLALQSGLAQTLAQPWTLLTYMFVHISFWHLLVNVMWLAWFGALLGRITNGRTLIANYMAGGMAGAFSYIAFTSAVPQATGTQLIGASAATLAVITSTLISAPDKRVEITFIGTFPLKRIAAAGLGIFVCASLEMSVPQTVAHAGGIIAGCCLGALWRRASISRRKRMEAAIRDRLTQQSLVEKARTSGYSSLSQSERLQLFNLSKSNANTTAQMP